MLLKACLVVRVRICQVQAHGGGMLAWGGRYYWVGEGAKPGCAPGDFGDGCRPRELELSQDFNLYSSADLASWTHEGVLLNQVRRHAPLAACHASLAQCLLQTRVLQERGDENAAF